MTLPPCKSSLCKRGMSSEKLILLECHEIFHHLIWLFSWRLHQGKPCTAHWLHWLCCKVWLGNCKSTQSDCAFSVVLHEAPMVQPPLAGFCWKSRVHWLTLEFCPAWNWLACSTRKRWPTQADGRQIASKFIQALYGPCSFGPKFCSCCVLWSF